MPVCRLIAFNYPKVQCIWLGAVCNITLVARTIIMVVPDLGVADADPASISVSFSRTLSGTHTKGGMLVVQIVQIMIFGCLQMMNAFSPPLQLRCARDL